MSWQLPQRALRYADGVWNLGFGSALHYALMRARDRWHPGEGIEVRSRCARHPLWCRHGTSDVAVFGQIFVHREYRCLDPLHDLRFIIDLGANVGFSSAYFLSRFPLAQVLAVEPDPGNFAALTRNLGPYGDRVTALNKAVWSHAAGLVLNPAPFGDGREWAVAVREAAPGEASSVDGIDLPSLIGERRVDLLKIDIEGAEIEIFQGDCAWLDRVDNLVIEVHGERCEEVFRRAIAGRGHVLSRSDELHVCLSPQR